MPKDKKRAKDSSDSDSDSGPDDTKAKLLAKAKQPSPKKSKTEASGGADALKDGSGEPSWSLGQGMKFVKVSQFFKHKSFDPELTVHELCAIT